VHLRSLRWTPHRSRGQSLVEFALVLPILLILVGGIIQFGMLFWSQNTLTQIARDTGRWAATQTTDPCTSGAAAVQAQANAIAGESSLLGYPSNPVTATTTWTKASGTDTCPPSDNQTVWYVRISLSHDVPSFIPFLNFAVPWCNGSTCTLTTSAQFRMEPSP
jgi:Flp pilus assembly protein TadG